MRGSFYNGFFFSSFLQELLAEARYYCMSDLVAECEDAMKQKEPEKDPVKDPVCCVPLITSQKEEQMLIQSTTKPVVKLLVNRHNNKYSYTRLVSFVNVL